MNPHFLRRPLRLAAWLAVALTVGCATVRTTNPPRTATEQLLISEAAKLAVEQLCLDPLAGYKVYLDEAYFPVIDREATLAFTRDRMRRLGCLLVDERAEAEVVVELFSGAVGINRLDFLIGLPSLPLPTSTGGPLAGVALTITPEIALFKMIHQTGVASVSISAWWTESRKLFVSSGPYYGRTEHRDYWVFNMGPIERSDLKKIEEMPARDIQPGGPRAAPREPES